MPSRHDLQTFLRAPDEYFGYLPEYMMAVSPALGVYPEGLKLQVRDMFGLHGSQRFTSLGYASFPTIAVAQDGIDATDV